MIVTKQVAKNGKVMRNYLFPSEINFCLNPKDIFISNWYNYSNLDTVIV